MQFRRHHLIEEAKAEVDVVYEEVKRIEGQLLSVEREFGSRVAETRQTNGARMADKIETLTLERDARKREIDAPALYMLEKSTLERFAVLTSAFSTVCLSADAAQAARDLRSVVFRPGEIDDLDAAVKTALDRFAASLWAYAVDDASAENDRAVRESWLVIEEALRGFGRAI